MPPPPATWPPRPTSTTRCCTAGGQGDGQGYLTARAYFGALIAFVLLQDQLGMASIRPVDANEYIRHLALLTARGRG